MHVKNYIKIIAILLLLSSQAFAWDIDLSRRRKNTAKQDPSTSANGASQEQKNADLGFLDNILPTAPSSQEIVVLSTENGFIPKTVRVKKDMSYVVYVVNVNEKEKNVSFILDAFSEHHGTYFGKIKKFEITPRKEGIYSFMCPETSAEGRLVVYTGEPQVRNLSSEGE